jgi:hypothetical protein
VLVDGAIDRRASASSDVADAVILATGLALSEDPEEVVERTAAHVRWLTLPQAPFAVPDRAGAIAGGAFHPWEGSSLLEHGAEISRWLPQEADVLVLPGAFTETLAEALNRRSRPLAVVVPDGTHVLMEPGAFMRLEERGVRVFASRPIRLVAVTVNPTSPQGAATDPERFLAQMQARLPGVPVYDLELNPKALG